MQRELDSNVGLALSSVRQALEFQKKPIKIVDAMETACSGCPRRCQTSILVSVAIFVLFLVVMVVLYLLSGGVLPVGDVTGNIGEVKVFSFSSLELLCYWNRNQSSQLIGSGDLVYRIEGVNLWVTIPQHSMHLEVCFWCNFHTRCGIIQIYPEPNIINFQCDNSQIVKAIGETKPLVSHPVIEGQQVASVTSPIINSSENAYYQSGKKASITNSQGNDMPKSTNKSNIRHNLDENFMIGLRLKILAAVFGVFFLLICCGCCGCMGLCFAMYLNCSG